MQYRLHFSFIDKDKDDDEDDFLGADIDNWRNWDEKSTIGFDFDLESLQLCSYTKRVHKIDLHRYIKSGFFGSKREYKQEGHAEVRFEMISVSVQLAYQQRFDKVQIVFDV